MQDFGDGDLEPDPRPRVSDDLLIAGERVRPGSHHDVELAVSRMPTGGGLSLPVQVTNGVDAGPCIWLSAAIHGNELNGVEIVRQVLESVDPKRLRGAILSVPIVNMFGFLQQSRYLPDGRDLNRSFPGSQRGSLAARLASLFLSEVVGRCQYGVDLHTAAERRTNLPQVRADLDDAETLRIARAFGAPVMLDSKTRDGSLREHARRRGARALLYEAGEPSRFDDDAIATGVRGVLGVLVELDMIDAPVPAPEPRPAPVLCRTSSWVRASSGGMYRADARLGDRVAKGSVLGFVADPLGRKPRNVRAPFDGIVIGQVTNPLVYRGDALVHLARPEPEPERSPATG